MNQFLLITLLALSAPALTLAQRATSTRAENPAQGIEKIEQELLQALIRGDTAPFERYMADTYRFTSPDGAQQTKAQMLADLKSGTLKMISSKNEDMRVAPYGDVAIVTYRSIDKGTYNGTPFSGQYRWTDVFVKRQGTWQIVSGQGTRIGQP